MLLVFSYCLLLCRFNSGKTTCQHHCDKEPDMVCGTDGHSYINQCYLMVEHCMRGVTLAHYGACNNGTGVGLLGGVGVGADECA